jgi:tetratricopeptide (TPR) repeat protein
MSKPRAIGLVLALALCFQAPFARATPEIWRRSYALEAQGDNRGALEALEALPAAERAGYLYALRHGWLLYLAGRYDDAVTAYRAAGAASPNAIEAPLGELLPLMALRRWQDAETRARAILRTDPANYLATRRLALIQYNLGRFDAALQSYRAVADRYPGDLEMLTGIGWCELRRGHRDDALTAFRAVLAVSDDATARAGVQAAGAP